MIKGLVENGELDLQAKESQLLWEDTSIYTFQDEDEVVTVTPVSSPEFDSWNLVTIIDANGEIESYEETQLRHLANDDVKITKWANGVPKGESVYNPNAPQIQRGIGEVYKRLNDCWGHMEYSAPSELWQLQPASLSLGTSQSRWRALPD